jgi:superoxide dismutase
MRADTIKFHYDVLSQGYVTRYNKGEGDLKFNKAGALLHNIFWPILMVPNKNNKPKDNKINDLIMKKFKSFSNFKDE